MIFQLLPPVVAQTLRGVSADERDSILPWSPTGTEPGECFESREEGAFTACKLLLTKALDNWALRCQQLSDLPRQDVKHELELILLRITKHHAEVKRRYDLLQLYWSLHEFRELRVISGDVGEAAFKDCGILTDVALKDAGRIGHGAFARCCNLETIIIPDSVRTIGSGAFQETGLTRVTIPDGVEIQNGAFRGCTSLTSVTIRESTIGPHAFSGCTGLINVTILGRTEIGAHAFERCTSLVSIRMPDVGVLGAGLFERCSSLSWVYMPRVVEIGPDAFRGCSSLSSVSTAATRLCSRCFMSSGLMAIKANAARLVDDGAFAGCPLQQGDFDRVERIGAYAFSGCPLTHLELPLATDIGNYAFQGCWLATVTTPELCRLGLGAFQDCANLTAYTIPVGVTAVSAAVFQNSGLRAVWIHARVVTICDDAFKGCLITSIDSMATWIGTRAFEDTPLERANLPHVLQVSRSAFQGCSGLATCSMPRVSDIGDYAFKDCHVLSELMPRIVRIGDWAFKGCYALTKLELPHATHIGSFAFLRCSGLTAVDLPRDAHVGRLAFKLTGLNVSHGSL
jgi:hypothetical protein